MAETKRTSQKSKSSTAAKAAQQQSSGKASKKTPTVADQVVVQSARGGTWISTRAILAVVVLALFVLLLVMLLKPEGALLQLFHSFVLGLVGKAAFIISVPALFMLFVILAFSRHRPVLMRSICLICFVLVCGCLSDFLMKGPKLPEGFAVVGALYTGGIDGSTAGLLCGGLAALLRWLCGSVISFIIFLLAGLILLLTAFNLTLPSIVRAIRNRPRPEPDEEEEKAPRREPAEVVVNHFANKHIEATQRRRQKRAEQASIDIPLDDGDETVSAAKPIRKHTKRSRADELMSEIDADPEAPLGVTPVTAEETEQSAQEDEIAEEKEQAVTAEFDAAIIPEPSETPADTTLISADMPPLVLHGDYAEEDDDEDDESDYMEPAALPVPGIPAPKVTSKDATESAALVAQEIAQNAAENKPVYCYPPIDLLNLPANGAADGTEEMRENSRRLNETLESFKIEAHIINVTRGPSVTRYEVELEKGVRLNKLTSCADDIALSLGASGVRIAAVPGKISVVGIEVPNRAVTTVSLREVIDSNEFNKAKSKSSFAVGKDIGGNCIVGNIAKLPHMLIAGTTGSGKSVCMNSIIISLLYKASPDDVKLIMVDPKMVELGIYNGIPHLLIPVVTDPKKAAGSLQWAVTEMMRRYRSMSDVGVRDLESYNAIVDSQEVEGDHLPQIVVIIDELADLMLVAAKEVEESICRIAQMGRAAGIHLVIATQRPSADVITGLMKANIPSRIAFAVASAMESRIILDTPGAEKLVGKGDMLYAPIGSGKPKRVQGCFVSDGEVEAVANYVKSSFQTEYDQSVMEEIEKKAEQTGNKGHSADPEPNAGELEGDEMLPAAVDVILETGQASVSMLQRRLKLGYARAARIVDEMEDKGIVGPFQGSKPRAILITKEQWALMRGGQQLSVDDLGMGNEGVPEEID